MYNNHPYDYKFLWFSCLHYSSAILNESTSALITTMNFHVGDFSRASKHTDSPKGIWSINICKNSPINMPSNTDFLFFFFPNEKALEMAMVSLQSHSWCHVLSIQTPFAVILFVIVSCVLCLLALHTNYHTYNLHESKCVSGSGDAIHAESVHHHFPPWTQCPEAEAKLQGGSHSSHHVITAVTQTQWQTQRWGKDRTLWKCRPKQ